MIFKDYFLIVILVWEMYKMIKGFLDISIGL